MANLTPVDHDPFASGDAKLVPVDHDPFADDVSTSADIAKSAGTGVLKAGIGAVGAGGDLRNLASKATDYIGEKLGASPEAIQSFKDKAYSAAGAIPPGAVLRDAPTSADIQGAIEHAAGSKLYEPKTIAGQYAQTAGEFAPALLDPEAYAGRLPSAVEALRTFASRVAAPAAASETAGQLTKGTDAEPYARIAAAVAAPAALSTARRVVTPFPANPDRAALVDTLANEGVQTTAGQRTGNKPLQWTESVLGDMPFAGGRPGEIQTGQQEQFTNAALRRTGENANRATPEVIDNAFRRIGNEFDQVGANNHVAPDHQFVNDLVTARNEYHNLVGPNSRAPVVDNTINDIAHQMQQNGGLLSGEQYNAMTSRLARQARGARNDPQLQDALQGMRDSMDDAFERTLQRNGNQADLQRLQTARGQYRNLMSIEKAATGAGSNAAEGLISPSQLRNAVVQQNRRGYARGQGDFADLARAGEAILKPLPQSGTGPRQAIQHMLTTIGAVGGATTHGAEGGLLGAGAALAGPAVAGRALMSRLGQAYLGNQAFLPGPANTRTSALARALLAAEAAGPNVPANRDQSRQNPVAR